MNATPTEGSPSIFDWPRRHKLAAFFPSFVALSLLAHIGTFFVFRVVYPERVSIPPPPPQVMLLTPNTPENQAFLRWVESEEPALVAASSATSATSLLEVKYRPFFETARTMPRMVANPSENVQFPPAKEPLEIIRSVTPRQGAPPAVIQPEPTTIVFGGGLSSRPVVGQTAFKPTLKSSDPLQPTEFLIAVTDGGEVRYAFLQKSSGVPALDAETADHLAHLSFQSAPEKITWGTARVVWGDNVYTRAPSP
jgi:hypothetical protein